MATFRGQVPSKQKQRRDTFSGGMGTNRLYGGPAAGGPPPTQGGASDTLQNSYPPIGSTADRALPQIPERQATANVWEEEQVTKFRRDLLDAGTQSTIATQNNQGRIDAENTRRGLAADLQRLRAQGILSEQQFRSRIAELKQLDLNDANSQSRAMQLAGVQGSWEAYNTQLKGKVQTDFEAFRHNNASEFERLQHGNQVAFSNVETRNKGSLIDKEWGHRQALAKLEGEYALEEAGLTSGLLGKNATPWQKERLRQVDSNERYRAAQDRSFEQWKMQFAAEQQEKAAKGYGKTVTSGGSKTIGGGTLGDGGGMGGGMTAAQFGGGRAGALVEKGISPRYHGAVDRYEADQYAMQSSAQARQDAKDEAAAQRQHELNLEDIRYRRQLELARQQPRYAQAYRL